MKGYDVLGEEVRMLVEGGRPARLNGVSRSGGDPGYESVEWNARDGQGMMVPGGAYFVRMTCDRFTIGDSSLI